MYNEGDIDCYSSSEIHRSGKEFKYNHFNKSFDQRKHESRSRELTKNNKKDKSEIEKAISHFENLDINRELTKGIDTSQSTEDDSSQGSFSEEQDDEEMALLNFNLSNRKYLPPSFSKKNYLIPKVFSASLSIKKNKLDTSFSAMDFGISETIQFKTKFPQTLNYRRVCKDKPPYLAPILVSLLQELEHFVPPLYLMTSGSSQETLETADALLDVMIRVNLQDDIPTNIANIFLFNVPVRVLTNTLQILFQRLQYPLFLSTTEFCKIAISNQYDIKYVRFGCSHFNLENPLIQALGRCLAISSNFQVANLAYFIEICQRWMREQIKCELDKNLMGSSELIYEEAAATLSMVFGRNIIGIPKHFVAHRILLGSLPVIDDIRRVIFYFLLGIPSFEFWHLWSISTLCFEDSRLKCKCKRGAFMDTVGFDADLEATPAI